MSKYLSTGQMIHQLKVGQKAEVIANGYNSKKVYKYKSSTTGYTEIRWEGTENILKIGGNMFEVEWKIL